MIRDLSFSHGCFGWLDARDASLPHPSNDLIHDNNEGWNQVGSRNKGRKRQTGSEFENSKMEKMGKQNAHVRRVFVGVAPQEQPRVSEENVAQEPKKARTNFRKKTKRHGKFAKTGNPNTMSKKLQKELFEKEKAEFELILRGFEANHERVAHECSTMFQQVADFSRTSKKVMENLEATRRFHSRIFDFEVSSLPDAWKGNGKKVFHNSIRQNSSNENVPAAQEDFFYPVLERLGSATGRLNLFQSQVAEINQSISYLKRNIRGTWNDARIALQVAEEKFAECYKDQFIGPIVGKNRKVHDLSRPEVYPSVAARQQEARARLNELRSSTYGRRPVVNCRQKPRFMTTERACAVNVSDSHTQMVPTTTASGDLIDLSDPLAIFDEASTASRLLNITLRASNSSSSHDVNPSGSILPASTSRIVVEDASISQQDHLDNETVSLNDTNFLPSQTPQVNTTDGMIQWLQQNHPDIANAFVDHISGLAGIGLIQPSSVPQRVDEPTSGLLSNIASMSSQTTIPTTSVRNDTSSPSFMRSRSVSFVPAPDPSNLPPLTIHQSLLTVPSSDSEPSAISSALHESLADCYDSLDDAGRQNLIFSAMASKDYALLQSLLQLQKLKGTFTLPKLSAKLLEQAQNQKLPVLAYDKDASKRRYYWNTWFMKLQIIVGLFSATSKFIDKNGTINLFDEHKSDVANGAVFILVQSYVDKYYADQLHSNYNGKGDQALLYFQ